MQLKFSKLALLGPGLLLLTVVACASLIARLPDRRVQPPRAITISFTKVMLDPHGFAGVSLAGAWRLTADDRRFGGLSALAVDRGGLVALSDSGSVVRFALPRPGHRRQAAIADLPAGPGPPQWKRSRDSEALARAPAGGWLVAFEYVHQLWRFDPDFRHGRMVRALGADSWPPNRGIEALVATANGALLMLPEDGDSLVTLAGPKTTIAPIAGGGRWPVSDAVLLADGRLLVLRRRIGLGGLRSSLAELVPAAGGYRYRRSMALGLGPLDNPEGMAAERLAPGKIRLWLVTDNDFHWPMRTLLVALDLPASSDR